MITIDGNVARCTEGYIVIETESGYERMTKVTIFTSAHYELSGRVSVECFARWRAGENDSDWQLKLTANRVWVARGEEWVEVSPVRRQTSGSRARQRR